MKNFKKKIASLLALVSIVSCMSAIPTYADFTGTMYTPEKVENRYVDYGTVIKSPLDLGWNTNYCYIKNIDLENKKTTIAFSNDENDTYTYTIDALIDDLILQYSGTTNENGVEIFYVVGYAVDLNGGTHNNLRNKGQKFTGYGYNGEVTLEELETIISTYYPKTLNPTTQLPDGTILEKTQTTNVQAIYNLDNKYIGYRAKNQGAETSFDDSIILAKDVSTIGDSSSTIGDSSTVGDSDVLPSEPTGIRGDVNYDGKVNVADIITLRRYLLHIIEW